MKNSIYFQRANLLLQLLPFVSEEEDFALKGGTAINFFIRDLPRLSVDIDLCYLPLADRESSLNQVSESLEKMSNRVTQILPDLKIFLKKDNEHKNIVALIVSKKGQIVKIEPNPVLRGTIYPVQKRELVLKAQALFEQSISLNCLSFADLYGGKICAALDRQHPRDLFDVKLLLENEGITDEIRKAFIVYLISHPRPIVELLKP
ncbi:MAG: nucleotidyl transferase AbiEii/AbiGii toxin family protein, partial [Thermodesulfobacteriota bacterium]